MSYVANGAFWVTFKVYTWAFPAPKTIEEKTFEEMHEVNLKLEIGRTAAQGVQLDEPRSPTARCRS